MCVYIYIYSVQFACDSEEEFCRRGPALLEGWFMYAPPRPSRAQHPARAVERATPGKRIKLPLRPTVKYIYIRGIRRDERTTAIVAEGCGIGETNRIFKVSFYDRRGCGFFIYTFFFPYTSKFVVPERKYDGESPAKRWRRRDVAYIHLFRRDVRLYIL